MEDEKVGIACDDDIRTSIDSKLEKLIVFRMPTNSEYAGYLNMLQSGHQEEHVLLAQKLRLITIKLVP